MGAEAERTSTFPARFYFFYFKNSKMSEDQSVKFDARTRENRAAGLFSVCNTHRPDFETLTVLL